MNTRTKVLVSAYACEPDRGSEPGIGWNLVRQIARHCEVWVITRANNRGRIESALAGVPNDNLHFAYFDLPRWAGFWKRRRRGLYAYYYLWQIGACRLARRLDREIGFDIAHHITFGTYWMPSFLSLLPVPFVWGPVGGGEATPASLRGVYTLAGRLGERLRAVAQAIGRCDPFVRRTARRAAVTLVTTADTAERVRQSAADVRILPAVGIPADEIAALSGLPLRQTGPFRMAAVGVLLHWKGFALAIRAFARLRAAIPDAELWLIGDGPERARLLALARQLGVAGGVRFAGSVPRAEVFRMLGECDVLVHPSMHDSGAYVCAEAMAAGRPVICLDLGGPALQVTPACGVKVPAKNPEQVVRDLALAMQALAGSVPLRLRMAQAARGRVRERLSWEQKGDEIVAIYAEVLSRSNRNASPAAPLEVRS